MDDKHPEIIIIKRHSSHEEEHHGGAWKIAFADFMTAMMAFFLVLWIINATDKNTKTIIARYFNPLKLEDMAKAQKGHPPARRRRSAPDQAHRRRHAEETGRAWAKTSGEADKKEPAAKDGGKQDKQDKQDKQSKETVDPAQPKAHLSETALLGDPYASLDKIAGKVDNAGIAQSRRGGGQQPDAGARAARPRRFCRPFQAGRARNADRFPGRRRSGGDAAVDAADGRRAGAPAGRASAAT